MRSAIAFVAGLLTAVGISFLVEGIRERAQRGYGGEATLDLNHATIEDFAGLELSVEDIERIVEQRPYRSKLELLERFVLPNDVYVRIKDHLSVFDDEARSSINVAS